jgi:hypothetical protein
MKSVLDEPLTANGTEPQTEASRRQDEDEAELARRIEEGINEAKAVISEKLDESKLAAERLLRHGKYAVEDSLSELAHNIKKHPISFLGIAFATGAAFGILLSQSYRRPDHKMES